MTAAVLLSVLALAAAAFVVAPLFRPGAAEAERVAQRVSEEEDLHAQNAMALSALRDLEEDRATGKIGDDDYAEIKAALEQRAVDLMKRIDALPAARERA
jgi:hypothetical protein